MSIVKFYNNKEIFITGGSGFIGKALVEKLLRSCPGISKIYLLIRPKRGQNVNDRLVDILKNPVFDRLREEQPDAFWKVEAIAGDCSELGLGLSDDGLSRLRNVSIIFHSAASVRFDDPLRNAILLNTRGTYELIKIAQTLRYLKVFVHVSTTYCNPYKKVIEEKVYPPLVDWREAIKLAESFDSETLNIFNQKYNDFQPNTYTFTKNMAEHIIEDHKSQLPVIIFRPAIVVNSVVEPVPGWIDNFNGPVGLLVAGGSGIVRTILGDPDTVCDYVPVDIVIRSMVVAACKKVLDGNSYLYFPDKPLDVYNCGICDIAPLTSIELQRINKEKIRLSPFEKTLWVPGCLTSFYHWHVIKFIVMHLPVAAFVDCLLRLMGRRPFLLRLQRQIFVANLAIHFFMVTRYEFKTENFHSLEDLITDEEKSNFGFMKMALLNYDEYIHCCIRGCKQFLLHESSISSQGAIIRYKVLEVLNLLLQVVCWGLVARFVYRRFGLGDLLL